MCGGPRACIRDDRSSGNCPWCCYSGAHSRRSCCCTRPHLQIKNTHMPLANQEERRTQRLAGAASAGGVLREQRLSVEWLAETHSHFPLNIRRICMNHQRRECGSVLRLTLIDALQPQRRFSTGSMSHGSIRATRTHPLKKLKKLTNI
ncbi:hypothetical protein ROHU_000002 [Labeo rohita]|uniref:Uncharacterized protein n=1 Tax=Labeo rohita TaxID=84645 RepID=A0A498P5X6_LABRO|nr:hypothetical protein ROHU_000002 [Labeo rohita]